MAIEIEPLTPIGYIVYLESRRNLYKPDQRQPVDMETAKRIYRSINKQRYHAWIEPYYEELQE